MLNGDSSHPSFDFMVTYGQGEAAYVIQACNAIPARWPTPVGYFNTAGNPDCTKENTWLAEATKRVKRGAMKKGAVDGTQRRNTNKRRMRRQFPGDGYVWETDTSPGM